MLVARSTTRICTSRLFARTFYTVNIPTDTPRVKLDDGSLFIHRESRTVPVPKAADITLPSIQSLSSSSSSSSPSEPTSTSSRQPFDQSALPPRLRQRSYPQRSILTPEQMAEARHLRNSDPDTWTVQQLARRYNTFPGFILKIAPCPADRKAMLRRQREEEFEKLPVSKKITQIDRIRRKGLW